MVVSGGTGGEKEVMSPERWSRLLFPAGNGICVQHYKQYLRKA